MDRVTTAPVQSTIGLVRADTSQPAMPDGTVQSSRRMRRLDATLVPALALSLLVHVGLAAVLTTGWYQSARLVINGGGSPVAGGAFAVEQYGTALDVGASQSPATPQFQFSVPHAVLAVDPAEPFPPESALERATTVRSLPVAPADSLVGRADPGMWVTGVSAAAREQLAARLAAMAASEDARASAPSSVGVAAGSEAAARGVATEESIGVAAGGAWAGAGDRGSGGEGDGASRPRAAATGNRPPVYPAIARQRGWEGSVVVRAKVRADGSVADVSIAESSGRAVLDEAALSAVRQWRFVPASKDGRAVESVVDVPITFQLR